MRHNDGIAALMLNAMQMDDTCSVSTLARALSVCTREHAETSDEDEGGRLARTSRRRSAPLVLWSVVAGRLLHSAMGKKKPKPSCVV